MSSLSGFTTNENVKEDGDFLGGGFLVDSGLYDCKIDLAYVTKSKGGAAAVNLHLNTGSTTVRLTEYISSGDAKGNKNTYNVMEKGKPTGEQRYLPGFNLMNALALLAAGQELSALDTEEKTILLYSYEHKKDMPQVVEAITGLIGTEVIAGIIKRTVNKRAQDASGNYVNAVDPKTAQPVTRDENFVDKFFRSRDSLTVTEVRAQATVAAFKDKWDKKNTGVTQNKVQAVEGAVAASGGTPAKAESADNLFT